ncbi:MAG: hypothetical protein Q7U75_10635 [Desulfobacterales bacterium]|nr:hypothetical protein [Desulfobacterales bacterium]
MAWFGGGALAAGGAGMAGGAAVLGGLFAIPMVYFAAKGSHKKAKELEDAKTEIEVTIVRVREQLASFPSILADVQDKKRETTRLCDAFIADVVKHSGDIRPYGILSATNQKLRSLFGKDPYTQEQAEALERLTRSVTDLLTGLGIHGNP